MTVGPHESRLRSIVDTASLEAVVDAQQVWDEGSAVLLDIARTLELAAEPMRGQFGTATGQAAHDAFVTLSGKVRDRGDEMKKAGAALLRAHGAIVHAETVRTHLDSNPLGPAPSPPRTTPGSSDLADVDRQRDFHTAQGIHAAAASRRESEARAASDHMDVVYRRSADDLSQVHGEPDPPASGSTDTSRNAHAPGGGGGSAHAQPSRATHAAAPGLQHAGAGPSAPGAQAGQTQVGQTQAGQAQGGAPVTPMPGLSTTGTATSAAGSTAAPTTVSGSTVGGVAGALGGGVLGGMAGLGGAGRGPLGAAPGSSATAGASSGRTGSTTRSVGAGRGVLGRTSGLAGDATRGSAGRAAATSTARPAAEAGRAASAGTGGGQGGSRTAAGARSGVPGGRGGSRRNDSRQPGAEHLLGEQDWVDDESAGPEVID